MEGKLLYDRKSAALALSMSVRSVDYYIADRKLKTRRKGKKVLIPAAELRRFAATDDYEPVKRKKVEAPADDLTPVVKPAEAA